MPYATSLPWLAALLGLTQVCQAQDAWQTTRTFPGGVKIGLIAAGDSTLVTAVPAGLLRTDNRGRTWQLVRRTGPVYTLFVTRQGQVLAGGRGKIYRSFDAGAHWDSVALATPYPVVTLAETPQGGLLAGTGQYIAVGGAGSSTGDGVFFSANQGQQWQARSAGLGNQVFVTKLVTDRLGRAYAAVADQVNGQPGLYYSLNDGQQWQPLAVRLPVATLPDPIRVSEVTALAVSPQDSLHCSFSGVYYNFEVSGHFAQSLANVTVPLATWTVQTGTSGPQWWNRTPLLNLYFARSGTWYSSRSGLPSAGGTLVSRNHGRSWQLLRAGLGAGNEGYQEMQQFVEFADGYLFMVKGSDERVYYLKPGQVTTTKPPQLTGIQLFPNPVADVVHFANHTGQGIVSIRLHTLSGQCLRTLTSPAPTLDLTAEKAGVYLLTATLADGRVFRQRLVKQ